VGLSLLVGPANAGKVSRLLERYLAVLEQEPVLIVPTRSDVEQVERELVTRSGCVFGGSIGTFDDVFRRLADGGAGCVLSDAQQRLVLRRAIARTSLNGLSVSARSGGFADVLQSTIRELESALLRPDAVDGDLARLYAAYAAELDALNAYDRELLRARAVERLRSELGAWNNEPVFAYGFEDLTAAEWDLLQGLAGRTDVTVSIPYEPGRTAFDWLRQTSDRLAALATSSRVEELPPRSAESAHPAIAHVERTLFETGAAATGFSPPPIDGAIRFFEGAGLRGAIELVAEEVADLVRAGSAPERIGVVCPSLERWRATVATAFGTIGIPYAFEAPVRLPQTAFGHALTGLLRFAWLGGGRGDLFRFLRTPYSGLTRSSVDFVEGRLRGRAVAAPARVEEELEELRGASLPPLAALRAAKTPLAGATGLVTSMLRAAYGVERPPSSEEARDDLRAYEACRRLLSELEDWESAAEPIDAEAIVGAFERATVPGARPGEPGRVAVTDLLRARTRRFDVVFLLGLEEGSLPRRGQATPFLDDEARERLGPRLSRADPVARDRYLFYTACARPTRRLYLVREAATDEGSPREASPFWEEVAGLFPAEEVARWTRRRSLSQLTWPLEEAPTERERLRALAALTADERGRVAAESLARANGWERRLERARGAFARPTRLRHPLVLEQLRGSSVFSVTELERFADCSSAWFIDRVIEPKTIDAEVDARLRGLVAHTALRRFYTSLPKELGGDGVPAERVEDAVGLMRRCLDQALEGVRMEMTPMQRRELDRTLWRDLEAFVRDEAANESPLVPSRFEVSFGTERSAPELQRGLELGDGLHLSGKIDRIDLDPFSARGIVQDYKTGKSAHSAREIERELRLQIPLYMLVLRDLVGIEPLGGVYRPLAGDRRARGLLRAEAREEALAGYAKSDYLDDESFWSQVDGARETAGALAGRIRGGDVRHDPRWGECPAWCDLWPMCRVRRP
jgi:ATP-dependent helicase/DNAse subunit B